MVETVCHSAITSVPPVLPAGSGAYVVVVRSGPVAPDEDGAADSEADGAADSDGAADADGAAADGAALDGAAVGAVVGALVGAVVGAEVGAADGAGVVLAPWHAPNAIAAHVSRPNKRLRIKDPPRS